MHSLQPIEFTTLDLGSWFRRGANEAELRLICTIASKSL